MMKMGPMGLAMFTRGRMAILPTKIRQIDQLQAIIRQSQGTEREVEEKGARGQE